MTVSPADIVRRWWFRVRNGLDVIELTLLERIGETSYDEVPIFLRDRTDIAMAVGYIRLRDRGLVEYAGDVLGARGYAITPAGRKLLTTLPGSPHA